MRQGILALTALLGACGGQKGGSAGDDDDVPDAMARADAAVVDAAVVDAADVPVADAAGADAQVTRMVIGAGGGTLTTPDGVVLIIPPGALTSDTTIAIALAAEQPLFGVVSKLIVLEPDGTQFAAPVQLTIPYDPGRLAGLPETDLALATRTASGFTGAGWVLIDAANDTATGYIDHFSAWAIVPAPPGTCGVNYGCMKLCSGSDVPNVCCSLGRSTCRSVLSSSFPAYVRCYAQCVGTPQVTNFGNSTCMSGCCTDHGWTVLRHGACYRANASPGQAQDVLDCARGCFGGSDQNTLACGSGEVQFEACQWRTTMNPGVGGECLGLTSGVNDQNLATALFGVYDQIWGSPPVVRVTGGTFDAASISISLTCATAVSASGSMTGTWNGTSYTGTYSFGTEPTGTFQIRPAWPL
jgi:hypothetical protein